MMSNVAGRQGSWSERTPSRRHSEISAESLILLAERRDLNSGPAIPKTFRPVLISYYSATCCGDCGSLFGTFSGLFELSPKPRLPRLSEAAMKAAVEFRLRRRINEFFYLLGYLDARPMRDKQ